MRHVNNIYLLKDQENPFSSISLTIYQKQKQKPYICYDHMKFELFFNHIFKKETLSIKTQDNSLIF